MATLYDIYFSGELVEGFDRDTVAGNLAKLFKANEDTVVRLLSGQPQRLKRGLDKAGALKYKKALANAGAVISIKVSEQVDSDGATDQIHTASQSNSSAETAGEAPRNHEPEITPAVAVDNDHAEARANVESTGGISLAPAGSDVLTEDERPVVAAVEVDTSALSLESPFLAAEPDHSEPPPPAPDVSHLSTAAVGEDIPNLKTEVEELNLDISHLDLDPEGSDFRELLDHAPPPPAPDTNGIDLAPEGSDVLEEQYRRQEEPPPPETDHISLEEPVN